MGTKKRITGNEKKETPRANIQMEMHSMAKEIVSNALSTRAELIHHIIDGGGKNLNKDCGYPESISAEHYSAFYAREGIAARVVDVWPEESWAQTPLIYETEDVAQKTPFEIAWEELADEHHPLSILARADVLSGIGRFGVILIGINDGLDLSEPVEGIDLKGSKRLGKDTEKIRDLLFLRPFQESVVSIESVESDPSNPRFGLPITYSILFNDGLSSFSRRVHWHRIVHLADRREMSDVFGVPRMQKNFNRLLDARKILGGSGEMFWKGGFPGYSFEVNSGLDGAEVDATSLRAEMDNYMTGLQRYLALEGVSAKSLAPQVADPKNHLDCQLTAIALSEGIPQRILFGSERGELASSQDAKAWNSRLKKRQEQYLTPFIVRPFVDRLIALGVLPVPEEGYIIFWPDLTTQSDQEKAEVVRTWADALSKYVAGDVSQVVPIESFLSMFANMEQDQILEITESLRESIAFEETLTPEDEALKRPINDFDEGGA